MPGCLTGAGNCTHLTWFPHVGTEMDGRGKGTKRRKRRRTINEKERMKII